eukprot:CAMPEP_0197236630 /NCGR_PEP_ID=MMETSP1429-20130617/3674_1 /TAXON_ID=49237 /ORGANISM="Chaetoceros  sp., Strain UNC1202" /LENGTH=414 /DNA_ID=CAMNT_0042695455 /DNA_START=59 /DNA_END=1304 /DNA_ORIENTATION=-
MSRWSPITCLPLQTLTPSGLINLDSTDGEVQLISRTKVELRSTGSSPLPKPSRLSKAGGPHLIWNDRDPNLTVTLTSHRIVFQPASSTKNEAHFLHHCAIKSQQTTGGKWTSNRSFKIIIETVTHGSFHLIFREGKTDRDAFSDTFSKALQRKQWEETYRLQENAKNTTAAGAGAALGMRKVGVDAIIQRNQEKHDRAKQLASEAFGKDGRKNGSKDARAREVEVLFREAKELTSIIHKYVATLEKNKDTTGKGEDDDDTKQFSSMLQDMGMITALTKDASSAYHETLARQIADFLRNNNTFITSKGGCGIITLTDVYCLFNRARGANMISPEDLIESLAMMERLGLGMKLRKSIESGVSLLQESSFDDSVMAKKLIEYIQAREDAKIHVHVGLTVLEAARVLKISPLLAMNNY